MKQNESPSFSEVASGSSRNTPITVDDGNTGVRAKTVSVIANTNRGPINASAPADTNKNAETNKDEFTEVTYRKRQQRKTNYGKNTAVSDIDGAEAAPY